MTATFCTSGAVKLRAGSYVSTALTDDNYTTLIDQAQSNICVEAKYNFMDNYASLNADVKYILEEATSALSAIGAINYNTSSYPSPNVAETSLDVNWAIYQNAMKKLKEADYRNFVNSA